MQRWLVVGVMAVFSLIGVTANAANLVVGTDYQLLDPAQPTSHPDKIVVTEFFSYQCPHCYHLSSFIDSWEAKLPSDVVFERIPVSFGRPAWGSIGQTYYSLLAMGKMDNTMDAAIFRAIHEQNVNLNDLSSITSWLVKQGIDGKSFTDMYNSFGIKMDMDRAEKAVPAYNIDGVPTLIVDGKYKVLSQRLPTELDMFKRELQTVDQLITMARANKNHK